MAVKLVRDAIQEAPGFVGCGTDTFRKVRDVREHISLALKKIHEELGELIEAHELGDVEQIEREAADLREILETFVWLRTGGSPRLIEQLIAEKQLSRGGFHGGLVWEHP